MELTVDDLVAQVAEEIGDDMVYITASDEERHFDQLLWHFLLPQYLHYHLLTALGTTHGWQFSASLLAGRVRENLIRRFIFRESDVSHGA